MTGDEDDRLMRAWVQGDARAFDTLYARHHQALYRFLRRVLGPALAQQVDEVFQDTWSRVIQARERWSPQGAAFRTWLFTLAHHRAIDCLRKSGREVSVDDSRDDADEAQPEPWAQWPASDASDPADQAFWRAAGERLLLCLDQLPAAQRAAFLLHHEDGLSLDDLARVLELGFETAKSRLRYAMSKLRTCMGAYGPAGGWT
jgi:RNA polymerase sigma factor (sigma-70 family)